MLKAIFQRFAKRAPLVLYAWELGGGLGHVNRLRVVASRLAARGFRSAFFLRSVDDANTVLSSINGCTVNHAPVFRGDRVQPLSGVAYNYTDVLHRCGYDAVMNVYPVLDRWRQIIAELRPALIVCDHSPTVVLAAAGRVPTVHVGSGFATPPVGRSFAALNAGGKADSKQREAEVLLTLRQLHDTISTPQIERVYDLLGFAKNLTCCLSDLDPYRSVRRESALGPVGGLPSPVDLPEGDFVFGYLNGGDRRVQQIIVSLVKAKIPCGLYIRRCPDEWRDLVAGSTVHIYAESQNLRQILGSAAAIIHHAGLATTEIALAIGRPQFLFPSNLEQQLTACAIERLNCGANLATHGHPGDFIRRAIKRGIFRDESLMYAKRMAGQNYRDAVEPVLSECDKHLLHIPGV